MHPGTHRRIALITAACWLALALLAAFWPAQKISQSERRLLQQRPQPNVKDILSGQYMRDYELYAKDQFPWRDTFRSVKAVTRHDILRQKENNGIYVAEGFAAKMEYPLSESSVKRATKLFQKIYDRELKGSDGRILAAVIPDKHYFLGPKHGFPVGDYDRLMTLMQEGMPFADFVDITSALSVDDYYRTDIHWRQECLGPVVDVLAEALGISDRLTDNFTKVEDPAPFRGVYAGQSALPLRPDHIVYLKNAATEASTVHRLDTGDTGPVYDTEKLHGRDPYDVYLSGALPLLTIENPTATGDRELVIFRDSFAGSLAPLLVEAYAKITLIDIRYMLSDKIGDYVTFDDQDVLFLYNTTVLNHAMVLK